MKILKYRIILTHYSNVIWTLRRLQRPNTRLFVQARINGNATALHHWPFARGTSSNQWFSSQKIGNVGCVSMAWRHDGSDLYLEKRRWHTVPFGLHMPLSLSIFHETHLDWVKVVDISQRSISNTIFNQNIIRGTRGQRAEFCHNILVSWNKHLIRFIFATLIIYLTLQKTSL